FYRLADIALGGFGVIEVVGGMPGHVGRVGAVVGGGTFLRQQVLGPLDDFFVFVVAHRRVDAVQALRHPARGAVAGGLAGGVGITLFLLLLPGVATAALAFVGGCGQRRTGRQRRGC